MTEEDRVMKTKIDAYTYLVLNCFNDPSTYHAGMRLLRELSEWSANRKAEPCLD